MIDKELSILQQRLDKVLELIQLVTSDLPQDTKINILESLSTLQQQLESTKSLAKDSFGQITVWSQEDNKINVSFASKLYKFKNNIF